MRSFRFRFSFLNYCHIAGMTDNLPVHKKKEKEKKNTDNL